ncbi:glutaminyl-peptide cyclotransferase [Nocardia sp. NBC_01329]|uniref:glutaminyl-peptide cyclotransferase n=1 Tax=Nocardia sp. NBC_01329 TaxID=2903594 RepID=UPI002E16711E|nr:glutaminyl-peptide cyclotransferase [Nocardia sp. NBC_01329]
MKRTRRTWVGATLLCLLAAAACRGTDDAVPRLNIEVLATHRHDLGAFTQGLEIDDDVLYESTGMVGFSGIRTTDRATGKELVRVALPPPFFGEGITLAGDTLWQITWKEGVAFARDPRTLAEKHRVNYPGEGWGLCTRDGRLVMSDGSAGLTFRDPVTFAPTGSVALTSHTGARLNELECAEDGSVYANSWPTDEILRIDPETGRVLAVVDAAGLLPATERAQTDVLNGIAQIPGTDHFLITGKYWPTVFEVRFVPA